MVEESKNDGWYIVYCQVGKEPEIKSAIEEKIKNTPEVQDKIFEILVPEEEEIQVVRKKKIRVKKAIYKGYMYIHMILSPQTYWFIRSVPGIKGFLGGHQPEKMPEEEIKSVKMLAEKLKSEQPKIARKFDVMDTVRIIDGPFKHFTGVVEEINEEKGKVKMTITVFGRPTIVELDFSQVEKI